MGILFGRGLRIVGRSMQRAKHKRNKRVRRPRVTGSEAWDNRSRTLRRVVFGFKIFGRRSGPLIEVDVDALANAAAMKMVLFPLLEWNLSFEAACTDWTSYVENNRPNCLVIKAFTCV